MFVIYTGMKGQSANCWSLEISAVCTFHALLKQNLYGKGKSSEVLVVYRNILDIRPPGFLQGGVRNVSCNKPLMIMDLLFQPEKETL